MEITTVQKVGVRYVSKMMKTKVLLFLLASFFIVGCKASKGASTVIEDAQGERICELSNSEPLGQLRSFCVVNKDYFAANTSDSVVLFGSDGRFIRRIGNQGRANGEYIMPWCVRSNGDNLFVWDADQLKFIEYDINGNHISQYQYDSALNDFRVDGDIVFIYTAGRRDESVIDILNLKDGTLNGINPASEALSHSVNGMALDINNGQLLYAPKDRLEAFSYDPDTDEVKLLGSVQSDSFVVPADINDKNLLSNRKKLDAVLNGSSRTVFIFNREGATFLVSLEGVSERDEKNRLSNDGRYYSLYRLDGKKATAKHYRMSSMGSSTLFAEYNGDLYYVVTELDGIDESVHLKKLSRKAYK